MTFIKTMILAVFLALILPTTFAAANQSPTANAGPDQTITLGQTVTLDGSASTDADGTITEYKWEIFDGSTPLQTLIGKIVQYTPNIQILKGQTKILTAYLTVTDDDGAQHVKGDSAKITVNPAASFDVQVLYPNGGEVLKGYQDISFRWRQVASGNFDSLTGSIMYSEIKDNFENEIKMNLDLLDADNCTNTDKNPFTWQTCTYTWNTYSASDGTYFLDVKIQDHSGNYWKDSSDNSFVIDNMPPAEPSWAGFEDLIEIIAETDNVYMANNDTIGVIFDIENISKNTQCMNIDAKDFSPYINAYIVGNDDFCLNAGEKTKKTMSITTNYAQNTTYDTEFIVTLDKSNLVGKEFVKVHVGEPAEIEIFPSANIGTVCKGKNDNIFFHVKNNSYEMKEVTLSVAGTNFTPKLKETKITIDPKTDYYPMEINLFAPSGTKTATYSVTVTATTKGEIVQGIIPFEVITCQEEQTTNLFKLEVASGCTNIKKDEEKTVGFTVKNLTKGVLKVNLTSISPFWSDVPDSVELEAGDAQDLLVTLKPVLTDAKGQKIVKITAWSGAQITTKEFCVNVEGKPHTNIKLEENNLEAEQGEQIVFMLTISNDGDTNQNFGITEGTGYYDVTISDGNFMLKPNKQKEVFVSVMVDQNETIGKHTVKLLVTEEKVKIHDVNLNFNVIEKTVKNLKIDSLPAKVTMKQGESQVINFSVTNLSNIDLEKVTVSIKGLPKGVTTAVQEFSLEKGATKQLTQQISVAKTTEPELYKLEVKATAEGFVESQKMWLYIPEKSETAEAKGTTGPAQGDFVAGLAALGGSIGVGLMLLIVIAILLIALVFYGKKSSNSSEKPEWIRKR